MRNISVLLLHRHTTILLAVILLLGFLASMWMVKQEKERLIQLTAQHFAEDISLSLREFRTLYSSKVVNRLESHGIEVTHDYAKKDGAIPLPATLTMELTERLSQSTSLQSARLYSAYPFPWRKQGGPLDSFEHEALAALRLDPDQPFMRIEQQRSERVLRYATADLMRTSCLNCHNTHPDSPKTNWKAGDVRGVLAVNVSLDHKQAIISESGMLYPVGMLVLAALLSLMLIGLRLRLHTALLEKEVEARTRETVALARFPQENPSPMLRISSENKLEYANPASAYLLESGVIKLGETISGLLYEHCITARKSNKIVEFQLQTGEHWYTIVISPAPNANGEINIYGLEITERKKSELKLQHLDRVESLGVLAGGIAHDFNNLLTAILGNASLALKKMNITSPAFKHLESIENASHSAADLCRQMLAYSGKGQFIIKPVNLSELLENMGKLIEVSLAKNVVLTYHLSKQLPAIDADIAQMQQIVLNLITNASEAIDGKSGVLSLTTGVMHIDADYLKGCIGDEQLETGRYVYLEVSDTGCGMDIKTQKKIFDPFFTTKFTGRGLGMSAMLGIVQGHKGALRIYSEVGKGTTIKVAFPISHESAATTEPSSACSSAWESSGTVLIIDDEETVREVATVMLEDFGFDVITANNGREGVEVFRQHKGNISLVLLDMTMPIMDGAACFSELRKIDPDVRVILSSGYNEQDTTNRFVGKGLVGFIQKPYSADFLAEKLQEVLNGG